MQSLGIGQVGVGGIAATHREGYDALGLSVVAGYDIATAALAGFREERPDAAAYDQLSALLADPAVGVVDVAAPHQQGLRTELLEAVLKAGKPALVQKPLAVSYPEAEQIAVLAERFGVPVMVNQNMCFAPNLLGLQHLVCVERLIGTPSYAQIRTEAKFDTDRHPWYGRYTRWWTAAVGVHHLALAHHLLGPPETVYALIGHEPGQPGVTGNDGYGHLALKYANGMQALVILSGTYYGAHQVSHGSEFIWVQGPDGGVDCRPDGDLVVSTRRSDSRRNIDRITRPRMISGDWFPMGFGLSMRHFQDALAEGVAPWCSITDNLYVVAAIEAAYRSAVERREVSIESIMDDRYDPAYGPGSTRAMTDWVAGIATAEALYDGAT